MTFPKELQVAALLGTERQPLTLPPTGGPLGDLMAALEDKSAEARLLGAAAAVGLYRDAGCLPAEDDSEPPTPSPTDTQPVCARTSAQRKAIQPGGSRRDVLPETLALLAAAGKRIPDDLLPDALTAGQQQKGLRPALLAVVGRRGRWLAAQNPDWAYAALQPLAESVEADDTALETQWQTGNRSARVILLNELRTKSPEQARTLLQSTWTSEGADDRSAFLSTLTEGLSLADEPFLESALDDRSKEVRRVAADLLARLPGSALVARMTERADALLRLKRSLLGKLSLDVTPPAACDAAMQRDGVELKPSYTGLGEKAWWLSQIVAAIPLAHWDQAWNQPPEKIIGAAAGGDWSEPLLLGWQRAAARHPNDRWIAALASFYVDRKATLPGELAPSLEQVSTAVFEALVMDALRASDQPLHDRHAALELLSRSERPWSPVLARAVVTSLQRRIALPFSQADRTWHVTSQMRAFALRIPPALADELSQNWPEDKDAWKNWENSVRDFLSILHFRQELHKEITR